MLLLRLLPRRRLEPRRPAERWRPGLWQIVEQDCELRGRFGLERLAHPVVELRCIDPSLRHVFLQKSDRLVTVGIADARFHGSPCRVGWLVLRRLRGGSGSGVDDSVTTPSILGPRASELASGECRSIW